MSFSPEPLLRKATSRAKSDVANKLVSMLLHELSRRVYQETGLSVNSSAYAKLYVEFFGDRCPYCSRELKEKAVAVEHPDGMNRFRAGLHVPGNVIVSCSDCNREKRRDDQLPILVLAPTGWESFLSHDSTRCSPICKTCIYWRTRLDIQHLRTSHLSEAIDRIQRFRAIPEIAFSLQASRRAQEAARINLLDFYRDGQSYAQSIITSFADTIWNKDRP